MTRAKIGHNSAGTEFEPDAPTDDVVERLEATQVEAVKPREWTSHEDLSAMRKQISQDNKRGKRKPNEDNPLTEAMDADLTEITGGNYEGSWSGSRLGQEKWRRDAIAGATLRLVIKAARESRSSLDPALRMAVCWLCDNPQGQCTVSQATLAKLLNRSRSSIVNAVEKLKDDPDFEVERTKGGIIKFAVRVIPADAMSNMLNMIRVFDDTEPKQKMPGGTAKRSGKGEFAKSEADERLQNLKSVTEGAVTDPAKCNRSENERLQIEQGVTEGAVTDPAKCNRSSDNRLQIEQGVTFSSDASIRGVVQRAGQVCPDPVQAAGHKEPSLKNLQFKSLEVSLKNKTTVYDDSSSDFVSNIQTEDVLGQSFRSTLNKGGSRS